MVGPGDDFSRQKEIRRNTKEGIHKIQVLSKDSAPPIFMLRVASSEPLSRVSILCAACLNWRDSFSFTSHVASRMAVEPKLWALNLAFFPSPKLNTSTHIMLPPRSELNSASILVPTDLILSLMGATGTCGGERGGLRAPSSQSSSWIYAESEP